MGTARLERLMDARSYERIERLLLRLSSEIAAAAASYEARWTLAALHRTDADLYGRLRRQIDLWQEASRSGDGADIEAQGEALVRGYRRAVEVMTTTGAEDDAYVIGRDEASGLVVAIGHQAAAATRVAERYPDAVWLSADEVAGLLNSLGGFDTVAAIKRTWPGAVALPQKTGHHA